MRLNNTASIFRTGIIIVICSVFHDDFRLKSLASCVPKSLLQSLVPYSSLLGINKKSLFLYDDRQHSNCTLCYPFKGQIKCRGDQSYSLHYTELNVYIKSVAMVILDLVQLKFYNDNERSVWWYQRGNQNP